MKIKKQDNELFNFYWFAIGQFVSQFGSKMTSFGLILWSYKESGSVLSTSLLTVCYLFPEVLFSFIAGTISDSWNKKKIMVVADTIAAMFSLGVYILLGTKSLRLEYLYLINFILGITDSFQSPASAVTVSVIVSKDNYIKTSGLQSFFNSFTGIFAPVAATSIYAFSGLKNVILIDLSTFLFAIITLLTFVKVPKVAVTNVEKESLWGKCKIGIKYILARKDVFSLIQFMAFINFIAAIYNAVLTPMILSRNGNNDVQLGIVTSAIGIAGLFGSIMVTKVKQTLRRIPLILNIMSFSFLICNSMLGVGRNYYIWTTAVFLGNLLIPLLLANVEYIMRTKIPVDMQGRVFSARNTLQYSSIPIGNITGGFLADRVFEPYMTKNTAFQSFFEAVVGKGAGNGIALLYIFIGIIGFAGCCIFRMNKNMRKLDEI